MRTRKAFPLLAILAGLAALLSLTGCPASIYYTLENEVETTDNTLQNEISILGIAALGGNYYAAAGSIWKGTPAAGSVTWDTANPLTLPAAGALSNMLVEFGGDLYGGFFTQPATLGLYRADGPSPTTFVGGQVTHALVTDKQVALLAVLRSGLDLIVSTATPVGETDPFEYDLLLSTDGSSFTSLLPAVIIRPFTGVAYTSTPDTYWAVAGTSLYSGAAGALAVDTRLVKTSTDEVLNSVTSDDGTRLFVTSNLGYVYYSPDEGTTWYRNSSAVVVGSTTVSLLTVAGGAGSSNMLVGSDGYGYYILAVSTTPTLTRFDVSTIDLYAGSVRQFLIDGSRLFACTNMTGLWRNESFNSTSCDVGDWVQE